VTNSSSEFCSYVVSPESKLPTHATEKAIPINGENSFRNVLNIYPTYLLYKYYFAQKDEHLYIQTSKRKILLIVNMKTTFSNWMLDGLKIFTLVFLIGRLINSAFIKIQKHFEIRPSIEFGLVHLIFILSISYFLHVFTSDKFSDELSISSPSVLYSGLLVNLQSNLFYNFGV
jgi:hypothetical protein